MTADRPWDARVFERIESGVDGTLIEENLRLTPTERLERMLRVLRFVEEVRSSGADGVSKAS